MSEVDFLREKCLRELRGLVDYWRCSLPERFPESMIQEDIQDQVVEIVNTKKCDAPVIYYNKGRRYLDREEWILWFTKHILTHYE